ncbi:Ser/Thr protein kinase RdoA (MazF antagonist) [Actinokineospora baliensis]|uniref:phosphotransferase enzyme family protein n=1 Tax=Actinokineospora baliensis TaxID=547056 RepID=UPI001956B81E|nr:phosphotransferase [Actinokineospora baliensis]MBM7774910.1 Ser/Thr protein kinase RdoA (MazF antagonist) [Actinokineospora baliensis]
MNRGPDLDELAWRVLRAWRVNAVPERVVLGVNKATWRVGEYWLSSEHASARDRVTRLATLLARLSRDLEIAVPEFVRSTDGPVVELGDRLWWLTRHIGGRHPDPSNLADMTAVATGLGTLHSGLAAIPPSLATSGDSLAQLCLDGAALAARLDFSPEDLRTAQAALDIASAALPTIRTPLLLTHGDPSNPNLLIADAPTRLTGAIDWDNAREDHPLSDVATMAHTVVFRSSAPDPRATLDHLLDAYRSAGWTPLTVDATLVGVIMVLFEAIAHHGARYLHGTGPYHQVAGRLNDIRAVMRLLGA